MNLSPERSESSLARLTDFTIHVLLAHLLVPLITVVVADYATFPKPSKLVVYVTAFLCLLVALAVTSLGGVIARFSASRIRWQLVPTGGAVLGCFGAAAAAVGYPPTGQVSAVRYMTLWLCLTLSTLIILTITYYQRGNTARIRSALAQIGIWAYPDEVAKRLEQIVKYLETAGRNKAIGVIGGEILKDLGKRLDDLEQGILRVNAPDVASTFTKLGEEYDRFHGVSVCPIGEWNEPHADVYLAANRELVQRGTQLTRFFPIQKTELQSAVLLDVLKRHDAAGVPWAVALFPELPRRCQRLQESNDLHFGIWDTREAGSKNGGTRKACSKFASFAAGAPPVMTVLFGVTTDGEPSLTEHVLVYREIVSHVWICSKDFWDMHKVMIAELDQPLSTYREDVLRRARLDKAKAEFPIKVSDPSQLEAKVSQAVDLLHAIEANSHHLEVNPLGRKTEGDSGTLKPPAN